MSRKQFGARGEAIALRYLRKKGFILLERNWHCRFGELDLILLDDGQLVGVEVKTRRTATFGQPAEDVGERKMERLAATLESFRETMGWPGPYRLDVIGLVGEGPSFHVEHLRGVGE